MALDLAGQQSTQICVTDVSWFHRCSWKTADGLNHKSVSSICELEGFRAQEPVWSMRDVTDLPRPLMPIGNHSTMTSSFSSVLCSNVKILKQSNLATRDRGHVYMHKHISVLIWIWLLWAQFQYVNLIAIIQ